ncbi:outer membrane lipoprotein carrier protein LolA [Guyparkeria sp.]|uniref:outer membrane lipoprotein carrier protein LolA n=1 Tax=Guyparkeria sp. TaxID=2035736 RepID=UPI003970DCC4
MSAPRLTFAVLSPLLLLLSSLPAQAIDLETLATALAERGAGSTAYRQTRHLGVLDEPLHSSGRLIFEPPDRLIQEQREPEPQRLMLAGERLVVEADGRRREIDLADSPRGAALAASLRGVLNGRFDALEEDYELDLDERHDGGWRLTLLPRDRGLAKRIRRIEIIGSLDGDHAAAERLTMEFANGDRSVMHMQPAARDAP